MKKRTKKVLVAVFVGFMSLAMIGWLAVPAFYAIGDQVNGSNEQTAPSNEGGL